VVDDRTPACEPGPVMRALRAAVVLSIVLACAARGDARTEPALTLHYDVYYRAFPVLAVEVTSHVDRDGYRSAVSLRTAGLLGLVAPWDSKAVATGAVDGDVLRPAFYRAESAYGSRRQLIDLTYRDTGAVYGQVDGMLSDGERGDVPGWLRDGTVDPITASALSARRLAATGTCAGTVPVFDGLRRYDLHYADHGTAALPPSRRDPYTGTARHCRATVHSIAGFLLTGDRAGERATELSAWLAPPVPGASPVAVRIDVTGTRGTLHAHLTRAAAVAP
jgi:hypothetical protein